MTAEKPKEFKETTVRAERAITRRGALLRALGLGTAFGAAVNFGTDDVLNYFADQAKAVLDYMEKQYRTMEWNLHVASGALEEKLMEERQELQQHYQAGKMNVLVELGVADQTDLDELESIIENLEEVEAHYDVGERLHILKDKIVANGLEVDQAIESRMPDWLQNLNDGIRSLAGKPTGEEGKKYRAAVADRFQDLVEIYTANENNRVAQGAVLEQLNDQALARIEQYLRLDSLDTDERALYLRLRREHSREGGEEKLRDYILNYETYDAKQEALETLQNTVEAAQRVYDQARANMDYATELQGLLKEGIELKTKARAELDELVERAPEKMDEVEFRYVAAVEELTGKVDALIGDLKEQGYDIETKQDHTSKTEWSDYASHYIDRALEVIPRVAGIVAGVWSGIAVWRARRVREVKDALGKTVKKHNEVVRAHGKESQARITAEEELAATRGYLEEQGLLEKYDALKKGAPTEE